MVDRLKDKVAVITGGGGAMGGAQARLFASEGASICIADNRFEAARSVCDDITQSGGVAIAVELDVRSAEMWVQTIAQTEEQLGHVGVLCNNAGANFRVGFEEQTEEQFRLIMDVGLTGSFLGIQAVVPSMRKFGSGVILNMGSLAAIRPGGGSPGYAAQKMAMIGLTRSAAHSRPTTSMSTTSTSRAACDRFSKHTLETYFEHGRFSRSERQGRRSNRRTR